MNGNELTAEARTVLMQLMDAIHQLNYDEYTEKIGLLSNSTIGEHTRHIIELFQQLLNNYELGVIDYDKRKRDLRIQENIDFASDCIAQIIHDLEKEDKPLQLVSLYNRQEMAIETNYFRELMYNIEHCIHHQAILKIAFVCLGITEFHEHFGVAKATILFKQNVHR